MIVRYIILLLFTQSACFANQVDSCNRTELLAKYQHLNSLIFKKCELYVFDNRGHLNSVIHFQFRETILSHIHRSNLISFVGIKNIYLIEIFRGSYYIVKCSYKVFGVPISFQLNATYFNGKILINYIKPSIFYKWVDDCYLDCFFHETDWSFGGPYLNEIVIRTKLEIKNKDICIVEKCVYLY